MTTNTKPIDRVSFGSVQAAIWRNQDQKGNPRYNFSIERRYADADGNWQSTGSFGRDDSLVVSRIAERIFERIHELQAEDRAKAKQAEATQGAAR